MTSNVRNQRTVRRILAAVAVAAMLAANPANAQVGQPAPDGTIVQCAFALTVYESLSGDGSYKNCGGYEFSSVGAPFSRRPDPEGELKVAVRGADVLRFRFSEIPLAQEGRETPTLLLDHLGAPTRVVVIRRPDRINILVGETGFKAQLPTLRARK